MTAMNATCPRRDECEFMKSLRSSPLLKIKYATMYPYCNSGKHESCMRWWLLEEGKDVPGDLLPDGGRDWFGAEAHRAQTPAPRRVLVVDDMPLFRKALVGLVQDAAGHDVRIVEADSAESALEVLTTDTAGWTLVVTDYNMGVKTGYDLILNMRANPAHSMLPAIVFSSDADDQKRAQCMRLPHVRWLAKRPDREPFLTAWGELVTQHKA